MGELRKIPNVGERTEKSLINMGYTTIESLRGKSADELYVEDCALRGNLCRCQLYMYRAIEYWVNTDKPDADKCNWHLWKDEAAQLAPCGVVCAECARYPKECGGCRKIEGVVHWTQYTGDAVCKIYDCVVNNKKTKTCAACEMLPCDKFIKDPTISDEENAANLQNMIALLKKSQN